MRDRSTNARSRRLRPLRSGQTRRTRPNGDGRIRESDLGGEVGVSTLGVLSRRGYATYVYTSASAVDRARTGRSGERSTNERRRPRCRNRRAGDTLPVPTNGRPRSSPGAPTEPDYCREEAELSVFVESPSRCHFESDRRSTVLDGRCVDFRYRNRCVTPPVATAKFRPTVLNELLVRGRRGRGTALSSGRSAVR